MIPSFLLMMWVNKVFEWHSENGRVEDTHRTLHAGLKCKVRESVCNSSNAVYHWQDVDLCWCVFS